MRLEKIPYLAIDKIYEYLDPESRINFLSAFKPLFQKPQQEKKPPRLHCFFCILAVWYHDLAMGHAYGGGEDFAFTIRNRFDSREIVRGDDDKKYQITKYSRRDFTAKSEEEKLNWMFFYFGKIFLSIKENLST